MLGWLIRKHLEASDHGLVESVSRNMCLEVLSRFTRTSVRMRYRFTNLFGETHFFIYNEFTQVLKLLVFHSALRYQDCHNSGIKLTWKRFVRFSPSTRLDLLAATLWPTCLTARRDTQLRPSGSRLLAMSHKSLKPLTGFNILQWQECFLLSSRPGRTTQLVI
jgi:hypothetical protein